MAIGRFNILWAAAVVATMITVSPTAAARATVKGEYSQVGDPLLLPTCLRWCRARRIFPKTSGESRFAIWSNGGSERTTVTRSTKHCKPAN
jgi:hypothetical protein